MNTSVIIPARNEEYLANTIDDLFKKAEGEIEVIAILDGYWPDPSIPDRPNLTLVHHTESIGMRASINEAANLARGKYWMKCDAHCLFDEGWDRKLIADCRSNWTVVPRRYALDIVYEQKDLSFDTIKPTPFSEPIFKRGKQKCDYQYIRQEDFKGKDWKEFKSGKAVHDLMTFQGSCWFMFRQRFFDLDCLDDINYGHMGKEAQEICLKSWLSGGKCVVHKTTWYAHWDKPERGYTLSKETKDKSRLFAIDFWTNNRWPKQTRSFEWLLKKFEPVPTWPILPSLGPPPNEPSTEEVREAVLNKKSPEIESVLVIPSLRKYFISKKMISRIDLAPITIRGFTRGKHLYRLFKDLGLKVGVEVGTKAGKNAERICAQMPGVDLSVIDPWIDYNDDRRHQVAEKHESFYQETLRRLTPYNVKIIRAKGMDAVNEFPLASLDFVFIDGNHSFDYVMEDLIAWSRRVKAGGIVSGHDYYRFQGGGVVEAVNAYTKVHGIGDVFLCNEKTPSFFWRKP